MTPEIAEKLLKRFEIAPTIHDLDALTYEMLYNIINGHAKVYDADTHVAIRTEVAIAKGLVKESDFIPTCPKIGCASDDITFEPLGGIWECMKCHSTHTQPLRVPKS